MNLWRKINKRLKMKCRSAQNESAEATVIRSERSENSYTDQFYANDAVMIAME